MTMTPIPWLKKLIDTACDLPHDFALPRTMTGFGLTDDDHSLLNRSLCPIVA
jgi:hypothetical protein